MFRILTNISVVLLLGATLFQSPASLAGSCCSTGCIDIVPCPPSEPIVRESCDPKIRVFEITGYFEYWTEFMHVERSCKYSPYQFEAMAFDDDSFFDQAAGNYKGLKKIIVQPWWAWGIDSAKRISNNPNWKHRKFRASGCFINPEFFLADRLDHIRGE